MKASLRLQEFPSLNHPGGRDWPYCKPTTCGIRILFPEWVWENGLIWASYLSYNQLPPGRRWRQGEGDPSKAVAGSPGSDASVVLPETFMADTSLQSVQVPGPVGSSLITPHCVSDVSDSPWSYSHLIPVRSYSPRPLGLGIT